MQMLQKWTLATWLLGVGIACGGQSRKDSSPSDPSPGVGSGGSLEAGTGSGGTQATDGGGTSRGASGGLDGPPIRGEWVPVPLDASLPEPTVDAGVCRSEDINCCAKGEGTTEKWGVICVGECSENGCMGQRFPGNDTVVVCCGDGDGRVCARACPQPHGGPP